MQPAKYAPSDGPRTRDLLRQNPGSVERRLSEEFVRDGYQPESAALAAYRLIRGQDRLA